MLIFNTCLDLHKTSNRWVLAMGNFDGFHLGHQQLLSTLKRQSVQFGLPASIMTFEPHPREFFQTQNSMQRPERIWGSWDLRQYLKEQNIEALVEQVFNANFSQLSADEFLQKMIKPLGLGALVVGFDFAFGKNREGGIQKLKEFCLTENIQIFIIQPVTNGIEKISTTTLKKYLAVPDLNLAKKDLGRWPSMGGTVVHGQARGRTIGIPTANIDLQFRPALASGVYAVRVKCIAENKSFIGVANLGINPTLKACEKIKFEIHIFDFAKDIYGQELLIEFCHFLRAEKKFENVQKLKEQILIDINSAKGFFK